MGLAFDPRTKVRHSREARQTLMEAREALAKHSRWGVAKFMKVVREILASEESSVTAMKLKLDAITEYLDRSGLPKRIEFDANADAFSAAEMRSIWREVCQAAATNPEGGIVKPIDAEFEVLGGQESAAGQGPRALIDTQ